MLFRNYTPFPHLLFESRDEQRRDFGVLVLRGTFEIVSGKPLKPVEKQEPVVTADQYFGEAGESSIWMETNLAPYKPKSDIHVNATAHAPGGKPMKRWDAGIAIGSISKQIHVTGPRVYTKTAGAWSLGEPVEVSQVPIRYEQAFGGHFTKDDEIEACEENTVGCGFYGGEQLKAEYLPAPQIVSPDTPNPSFNEATRVEGLGPTNPSWKPRHEYAGTFDDHWLNNIWPNLPPDFKFEFWNSAHPDLIYPEFLEGNEEVTLRNLTEKAEFKFSLPNFKLGILCRFEDGQMMPVPMQLDTLHLELPAMTAFLTWRAVYPVSKPMRALEARIEVPESAQSETEKEPEPANN